MAKNKSSPSSSHPSRPQGLRNSSAKAPPLQLEVSLDVSDPAQVVLGPTEISKSLSPSTNLGSLSGADAPEADGSSDLETSRIAPMAKEVQITSATAPPAATLSSATPVSVPSSGVTAPGSSSAQVVETIAKEGQSVATAKPSWTNIVQGQGQKMEKKGTPFMLASGEVCVKIPNSVITKNKKCWDNFIIGQFKGKPPSLGTLHAITNGIWSNRIRDITVSKLTERAFLIRIPNAATRMRVLAQGMWHIDNQPMFVAKWEPGLSPEMPELTSIPVWLEFRKVPPHFFNIDGLEYIAGLLGDPKFLHPSTANMTNLEVAKVFTIVDPRKQLPETISVQFESGDFHSIEVSCPWLPPICDYCQDIGHSIKSCPSAPITCSTCNSSGHSEDKCTRNRQSGTFLKRRDADRRKDYTNNADFPTLEQVSRHQTTSHVATATATATTSAKVSSVPAVIPCQGEGVWIKKPSAVGIKIVTPTEPVPKNKVLKDSNSKGKEHAAPSGYNSAEVAGTKSGYSSSDASGSEWPSREDDNPLDAAVLNGRQESRYPLDDIPDTENFIPYVSRKLLRQLRAIRKNQSPRGSRPKYLH